MTTIIVCDFDTSIYRVYIKWGNGHTSHVGDYTTFADAHSQSRRIMEIVNL